MNGVFKVLTLSVFLLLNCAGTFKGISTIPSKSKIYAVHISGLVNRNWISLVDSVLNESKGNPVIFHITSSGGAAGESFLTNHGLAQLKEKYNDTPTYVYVDVGLYSGGYLVALPLGKIVVAPSAMVGSIGVVMEITVRSKSDSIMGLKRILFRSGKMKWVESGYYDLTNEQKKIIQKTIDYFYTLFIDEIIRTRKEQISEYYESINHSKPTMFQIDSTLRRVCDGREYIPTEALKLGLIDDIKFMDALIDDIGHEFLLQNVEIVNIY